MINYDQSLYSRRKNAETRNAIDEVNAEARALGISEDPDWGLMDTLRRKMNYLSHAKENPRVTPGG